MTQTASIIIQNCTDLNSWQVSSNWNKNPVCYLPESVLVFSGCIPTIAAIWERRKVNSSSRAAIFLIAASFTGWEFSIRLLCLGAGDSGSQTNCKGWTNSLFSSSSFFHIPFLWVKRREEMGRGRGWGRGKGGREKEAEGEREEKEEQEGWGGVGRGGERKKGGEIFQE